MPGRTAPCGNGMHKARCVATSPATPGLDHHNLELVPWVGQSAESKWSVHDLNDLGKGCETQQTGNVKPAHEGWPAR